LDKSSTIDQAGEEVAGPSNGNGASGYRGKERRAAGARGVAPPPLVPAPAGPAHVESASAATTPLEMFPMESLPSFDDLPDGVVAADECGTVVVFNQAAARITGIDPGSALGKPLEEALPLEDLEGRRWWSHTEPYGGLSIRRGQPETHLLLPGGRDVLATARYIRDGDAVVRVVIGLRDTSSRARAERRHSDLIATVAHELRSPLTSVKGFTATLLAKWERFTDDQRKLMLETVDADADRVTRLIAELLDIARIDSGRLQLARIPVDVRELVRVELAGMVAAGHSEERFAIAGPPAQAWADPDKLRQVLSNLLENAVRHGEGSIIVTVSHEEPPHAAPEAARFGDRETGERTTGMVAVTVDDEGPGIPEEMLGRVFTRFWRGNRRGGTGLGLYIVKGVIEAHGGNVSVSRSPSGGARFRFTVPAA
jgi:signal transduction histidine kinase